jgi:hypothetical protein
MFVCLFIFTERNRELRSQILYFYQGNSNYGNPYNRNNPNNPNNRHNPNNYNNPNHPNYVI